MQQFTCKVLKKGTRGGHWPAMSGQILEGDVLVGTFKRTAPQDGLIGEIEYKFRTEGGTRKVSAFADAISISECIEAMTM